MLVLPMAGMKHCWAVVLAGHRLECCNSGSVLNPFLNWEDFLPISFKFFQT